jgi:hypothetical protein
MARKTPGANAWRRGLVLASALLLGAVELAALQRARLRTWRP